MVTQKLMSGILIPDFFIVAALKIAEQGHEAAIISFYRFVDVNKTIVMPKQLF